jgi:DNA-binding GntR family transcriptional regulator
LILNHYFKSGERLVQDDLARQLGVSRTPVREAFHQLAAEGLVTISAYRGASVVDFSISELEEIYSIRIALEGYAAYLAAQRIQPSELQELEEILARMKVVLQEGDEQKLLQLNRTFHTGIYAAAKKRRLYDLIINYLDLAEIYRRIFVSLEHARAELVKHEKILLALRNRDADRAQRLTRSHLRRTAETLTEFLEAQEMQDMEPPTGAAR